MDFEGGMRAFSFRRGIDDDLKKGTQNGEMNWGVEAKMRRDINERVPCLTLKSMLSDTIACFHQFFIHISCSSAIGYLTPQTIES